MGWNILRTCSKFSVHETKKCNSFTFSTTVKQYIYIYIWMNMSYEVWCLYITVLCLGWWLKIIITGCFHKSWHSVQQIMINFDYTARWKKILSKSLFWAMWINKSITKWKYVRHVRFMIHNGRQLPYRPFIPIFIYIKKKF